MPPTAQIAAPPIEQGVAPMREAAPSSGALWALKRALQALLIGAIGTIIFVVTYSYNPFDPTGDTAGTIAKANIDIHNFLGRPGAAFGNILLQSFGWAALPAGLLMMFGSARAVLRPRVNVTKPQTWMRCMHFVLAVFFLAMCLAAFPLPHDWPMAAGLGGYLGDSTFLGFKSLIMKTGLDAPPSGIMAAITAFCFFGYFIGRFFGLVSRDVAQALDAAGLLWAIFRIWCDRLIGLFRRDRVKAAEIDTQNLASRALWEEPSPQAPHPHVQGPEQPAPVTPEPAPAETKKYVNMYGRPLPPADETPKEPEIHLGAVNDEVHGGQDMISPAKTAAKTARRVQPGAFKLPKIDLLRKPPPRIAVTDAGALQKSAAELTSVLDDFGVKGQIGQVRPGPVVTLYEFEPAPGVKSSRVINLADDIARSMAAQSARVAVVPGRNAIGIELPNRRRETVYLRDMLASRAYKECGASLPLALGEDIGGKPVFADLAKMPHLLVAGTTGSGKSVGINGMILSLMYSLPPEQCKFIMIDPKMLELSVYDGAPHLLAPVVTEPKKAVVALKWTVREMEDRYRKMAKMGVRSIAGFNEKVRAAGNKGEELSRTIMTGYDKQTGEPIYETETLSMEFMPFIVVIIDEMADLMMVAGKDIEGTVQRLAQMARAAGIHMIMATQRPSVDVITGTIKANFPTRISFSVTSKIDSRTILGEQGAEQLLGMGDMLYMAGGGRTRRLHGPFVSDAEVEKIANFIKAQGAPSYIEDVTTDVEDALDASADAKSASKTGDDLFDQAVAIVARDRKASTSYIQRRLSIGYNKAATLIERMEMDGMIGPSGPGGKREIFLPETSE